MRCGAGFGFDVVIGVSGTLELLPGSLRLVPIQPGGSLLRLPGIGETESAPMPSLFF